MSSSIKHLVVIIDLNPIYWSDKVSSSSATLNLKQYLNIIIQFCNAYIAFDINHRLIIIGCSNNETHFLYPDLTNESIMIPTITKTNMFEQLFVVDRVVENNLKEFLGNLSPMNTSSGSLITMALTQALCYINRLIRDTLAGEKNSFRILIIQTTNDTSKQYMNFMNAVFTSEKTNVPIDGCILNNDSSLLQQACDLTSGIYLRVPDPNGLLQYLLWLYLTDKEVRKMLALPTKTAVDYRPACFCHHKLIDTGYVCSVCLSIYCDNTLTCSTCRSAFDVNNIPNSTSNGASDSTRRQPLR
jgi:transcription initiation factor TFIIH subunit 3